MRTVMGRRDFLKRMGMSLFIVGAAKAVVTVKPEIGYYFARFEAFPDPNGEMRWVDIIHLQGDREATQKQPGVGE